jgi:hypothetical protein
MSIGMFRKRRQQELNKKQVKEEVYRCKFCDKEYKTEKGLMNHIETKHKDGE